MTKTSSVNVNTSELLIVLDTFNNLQDELEEIKNLSNLSNDLLIPNDFYNGCKVGEKCLSTIENNLNIGLESNNIFVNYLNTINSIKKYILELENANKKGSVITTDLKSKSNDKYSSILGSSSSSSVFGLGLAEGFVSENEASNNSNNIEVVDGYGDNVEGINNTSNTENIADLNNNIGNVSSKDGTTSNGRISDITNNKGNSNDIKEVSGKEVIDKVLDANGNLVAVAIFDNGKKIWYQVINGKVIVPANSNNTSTYQLNEPITIHDGVNDIIINPGEYEIDKIIYNSDGSIKIVEIKHNNYKVLLHLGSNGNIIKIEYIKPQTGVFFIDNKFYDIYDMFGVKIGKFVNGKYYIYETKYDQNGNVIAFRLSPDEEYEKWLVIDETTNNNEYSLVEMMQTNDKINLSMFEKNKNLFGLLGILFVALGVTVAVKIKKSKKEKEDYNEDDLETDDYGSYSSFEPDGYKELPRAGDEENLYYDNAVGEWEESNLESGNYPIYDVKKDENGVITEARINPLNSEDEYWVEV